MLTQKGSKWFEVGRTGMPKAFNGGSEPRRGDAVAASTAAPAAVA
jgi:hypothetical protein